MSDETQPLYPEPCSLMGLGESEFGCGQHPHNDPPLSLHERLHPEVVSELLWHLDHTGCDLRPCRKTEFLSLGLAWGSLQTALRQWRAAGCPDSKEMLQHLLTDLESEDGEFLIEWLGSWNRDEYLKANAKADTRRGKEVES